MANNFPTFQNLINQQTFSPDAIQYASMLQNMANPQLQPSAPVQPATPMQENVPVVQNVTPQIEQPTFDRPESKMEQSGTFLENAANNARRAGTGLVDMWVNKGEIPQMVVDYLNSNPSIIEDIGNLVLSSYNTKIEDFGKLPAKQIIANVLMGIHENPFDFGMDALSLGGGKLLSKVAKPLETGTKIERGIASETAMARRGGEQLYNDLDKLKAKAKEQGVNLDEVIEAAETGKTISKEAKPVLKELRKFSDDFDALAKEMSPETYVGKEGTAITQNILRKRMATNPAMTYAQVERDIEPMMELIRGGKFDEVKELAKDGNAIAKEVAGAKALYDKGRIFPISHGLANVEKIGEATRIGNNEFAKQFTRRAYGTSTFEDIASELSRPTKFLENTISKYTDNLLASSLKQGKLGGYDILAKDAKDAVYLNREMLNKGDLRSALAELRTKRVYEDDIALDKAMVKELKKQLDVGGALQGFMKDAYQTGKSTLTAQGTYLGANAITGAANAAMNSGVNLFGDIANAIVSKGNLAKQAGLYRRRTSSLTSNQPFKFIQEANRLTGGQLFSDVDRALQNTFAEIALHANIRKAGVKAGDRLQAITDMDKMKLGELISDTKRVALINSTNIPLPSWAKDMAFMYSPFWRWNVTAGQSALRMLEKSPLYANVVLMDTLANIGFDREMQNRYQLGVNLDKPYVTYKVDDKTGMTKEISAEFVPITTTFRTFDIKNNTYGSSVPLINSIVNALGGKDKYGKPIKRPVQDGIITRTIGTKTYRYNPATGFEPVERGSIGDIVTAGLRDTFGVFNLMNRTVLPSTAGMFTPDATFYQPYSGSLIGSYRKSDEGNAFIGGNPASPRTLQDVLNALGGIYERNYFPTREEQGLPPITKRDMRSFIRGYNTQRNRLGF